MPLSCTGDDRFNQYVAESNERLTRLQEDIQAKWKIGQYDHFDWDQQTGKIYSYMLLKNIRQAPPGYQPSHAGDRP